MKKHQAMPVPESALLQNGSTLPRLVLEAAGPADREAIYRIRHEVYARELGQHSLNATERLRDSLDDWNVYLVAKIGAEIAGFISLTPAGSPSLSIDKYFARDTLPFPVDERLVEVRLLTVLKSYRSREVAGLLMYGALRWVEAHDSRNIVAIGRREVLDLYLKAGLTPVGRSAQSGAVTYDLLYGCIGDLRAKLEAFSGLLARLEEKTDWRLGFPFRRPAACFHGGAFFSAIGERFDTLERSDSIINADVLDAWFPPSPRAVDALQHHLPWLLRTSPPTACEGLVEAIAQARGVKPGNVLPGAGSSDLIFRALREWLTPQSHALILDPTYGEYAHVLERVIGCTVDRLPLSREMNYAVDLPRLESALSDGYDLVVLVNPNSPTGRHIPRMELERLLRNLPPQTRVWVDETYVDYLGAGQSLESFAAQSENVLVCKSMSKVYALSGARVAYLCAGPHQLEALRAITPPWVVSLPAQVAAVRALEDPDYYSARYAETRNLRETFAGELRTFDWDIVPGVASFLLCHLPDDGLDAATLVHLCREKGLYIRDAAAMGLRLGTHAIRIAVKDSGTNQRMIRIISEVSKSVVT